MFGWRASTHGTARVESATWHREARPAPAKSFTRTTLPSLGSALMPDDEGERTILRSRLIAAGLYGRQSLAIFLGAKMLLIVTPALVGLALGLSGLLPTMYAVMGGGLLWHCWG